MAAKYLPISRGNVFCKYLGFKYLTSCSSCCTRTCRKKMYGQYGQNVCYCVDWGLNNSSLINWTTLLPAREDYFRVIHSQDSCTGAK